MTDTIQQALLKAPAPLFVVGGAVRDLALGVTSKDLDAAVAGDVDSVGQALAAETDGHYFVLHPASQTARVVLPEGGWIDLVPLPHGLRADLERRDFSINAMALPLKAYLDAAARARPLPERPAGLVDPTGGWEDLQRGIVRTPRPDAFAEDPLRALRGLRFSCTLPPSPTGAPFRPDADTRRLMREFAPRLARVSPERVRDEWLAALNAPQAATVAVEAAALGFLDAIVPVWRDMEGVVQNDFHHLDVWEHTLDVLRQLDALLAGGGIAPPPPDLHARLREYLDETPTPGHTRRAILRQGALLHDAGKPSSRTMDEDGRIRFLGHERVSEAMARQWAADYRLSGRERTFLTTLVGLHMRPGGLMANNVTPRSVQRFFRDANSTAPALLLMNVADRLAARGSWTTDAEVAEQAQGSWKLLRCYYQMRDNVALPLPLSGRDVMAAFQMPPGPAVGRLIQNLRDLHALQPFPDRESALEAARNLFAGGE